MKSPTHPWAVQVVAKFAADWKSTSNLKREIRRREKR